MMNRNGDDDEELVIVKVEKKPKVVNKMTSWVSSSFDGFTAGLPQPRRTPLKASQSHKTPLKASQSQQTLLKASSFRVSSSVTKTNDKVPSLLQTQFSNSAIDSSSRKRPLSHLDCKSVTAKKNITSHSNLWAEVHSPSCRADLAVHKKKIEEISDWLTKNITVKKHNSPILVLSGPPGAGKTACVKVLCKEIGLSVQQWENTSSLPSGEEFNSTGYAHHDRSKVDVYTSQSQSTQFSNFLLRANKYSPLACFGDQNTHNAPHVESNKKSVILVEELPNIFHRDKAQLHTILRKYHHTGQCPLIFIVTETNSSDGSLIKLFPKDLQSEIRISLINVNPVAPTMMMKCLSRVISLHSGQNNFFAPSHSVLEMIAQGCTGDLRAALNMLQFASSKKESFSVSDMKESSSRIHKKGSVSSRQKGHRGKGKALSTALDESLSVVGVKDTSVFLFHAVGKILHFKRGDPSDFPEHQKLPDHLSSHDRDPLILDPEDIVSKVHISADFFTSFLHENYVNFLSSVDDLERASEYFSHADNISALWTGRQELENYSVSLTTRGFIHSNSTISRHDSVRGNHGWRPLHKSQWYLTLKQAQQNHSSAKQLFQGNHWEPEVLCTEIIPYIHVTNPTLHDPGQISFVQQMTQFSGGTKTFRSRMDFLNEKEAVEDEEVNEEDSIINETSSNEGESNKGSKADSNVIAEVDEAEWGSDWEADDEDLIGSQCNVKVASEEDQADFVIDEFDD